LRLKGYSIPVEVTYDQLDIGRRIGFGACSTVNVATHVDTGTPYAVKMFNVYDDAQADQLAQEIQILAGIQCDALMSLKGAFHHEGKTSCKDGSNDRSGHFTASQTPFNSQYAAYTMHSLITDPSYVHARYHKGALVSLLIIWIAGPWSLSWIPPSL
jgi:serine/threonine protein kinase